MKALGTVDLAAIEAACSAASVRTTLCPVKPDRAANLLWHGYLLAMVNFVVFEGNSWNWKSRETFAQPIGN